MKAKGAQLCIVILKVINALVVVAGFGAIGCASWILIRKVPFLILSRMANQNFAKDPMSRHSLLETCSYLLLSGGLILLVLAGLGYTAVYILHRQCLAAYAVLSFLTAMLLLSVTMVCALYMDAFQSEDVAKQMMTSLRVRYQGPVFNDSGLYELDKTFSNTFDHVQVALQCCGVNNGSDYAYFAGWNRTWHDTSGKIAKARVPFTCCHMKDGYDASVVGPNALMELLSYLVDDTCPVSPDGNSYFSSGCYSKLTDLYTRLCGALMGVDSILVLIQTISGTLAFRLSRYLQRNFEDFEVW